MDDIYPEQRQYMRVRARLRQEIDNGILAPGSALPSIGRLCEMHNCSRRTAGRAMRILESEGLVYRVPGCGYFVAVHL